MKLPDIQYNQVQPLAKGSVEQEVNAAKAPYEAFSSLSESAYVAYDHYQLLQDQEDAMKKAQKSGQVSNTLNLLKDKQVNLSQLPPQIVEDYKLSERYDESELGVIGEDTYAPTHKVADSVYQWANTQYKDNQETLRSKRAYTLYKEAIGKDIEKSFESANAGVRASQIDALRLGTINLTDAANYRGEIASSLAHAKNAYDSGVINDSLYQSLKKTAYSEKRNLINENVERLTDDVYNQSELLNGNPEEVRKVLQTELNSVAQYGTKVINQADKSDIWRNFNIAAYGGKIDGKAQRFYNGQGYASAIGFIEMQEQKLTNGDYSDLPEGMTVKDAQTALSRSRALVQARRNALNSAEENTTKEVKQRKAYLEMHSEGQRIGKIISSGGRKSLDLAFETMLADINNPANGYSPEQRTQAIASFMQAHYNTMPDMFKSQLSAIDNLDQPERQLQLIGDYAYLKAMNPSIAAQFTGNTLGYLEAGVAMLKNSFNQPDSLAMVEQLNQHFKKNTEGEKIYQENLTIAKNEGAFKDEEEKVDNIIDEAFDDSWTSDPQAVTGLRMTIKQMRQFHLGRGVPVDNVDDVVSQQLKARWGMDVTDQRADMFDGNKVTFMPVAKVAGEYAVEQFELVKRNVFPDKVASGIYLEADGLTAYQSQPSWKIMYHDPTHRDYPNNQPYQINSFNQDNVVRQSVFSDGSAARWRPDQTDTIAYKQQKREQLEDFVDSKNVNMAKKRFYDEGIKMLEAQKLHPDMPNDQQLVIMQGVYNVMQKTIKDELATDKGKGVFQVGQNEIRGTNTKYHKKLRESLSTGK